MLSNWKCPHCTPQTTRQEEINQTVCQAAVLASTNTALPCSGLHCWAGDSFKRSADSTNVSQSFLLCVCPPSLSFFRWKTEDGDMGLIQSPQEPVRGSLKGGSRDPRQRERFLCFRDLRPGSEWVWFGKGQSCARTHEKTIKTT